MSDVVEFYDKFSERQTKAGINNRHLSVIYHLEKAGLCKRHEVLEIGCGVGTVSELILRYLSDEGHLTAVDISPKSVAVSARLAHKYNNATFEVKDFTGEIIDKKFDVIILPDVIEHIPFVLYKKLFENLYEMLKSDGFIFIHIPHPNYLEWLIRNKREELQIIDQPVYTDRLLSVVYPIGFYVHYLKSYSIYTEGEDYQIVILKQKVISQNYNPSRSFFRLPFMVRLKKKLIYLLRGSK
jgi:trans-aconitate 2-methyltransferase